ncbi:hypothetical protein B1B05_05055 [Domibacillus enclensis]|uniref:Uncharacterized protein n=1 Tax=Domibacillus enclensis TaxID=1017273 RepID=A0A1N6RUW1_9BACI|nr:hypothetical protein B1B05_05055 [Domibacillus enclensis]SIQ32625.1 hypothetical protein SAMN05443094_102225 [Domibacillus enclensis]
MRLAFESEREVLQKLLELLFAQAQSLTDLPSRRVHKKARRCSFGFFFYPKSFVPSFFVDWRMHFSGVFKMRLNSV